MKSFTFAVLTSALPVLAQLASYKPDRANGVSYSVSLPSSAAQSGSGDLYFQISAPTSYQWIGLGQGSQMSGSNMFIVYAASATNVTVSPRLGKGEFEPNYNSAAKLTVLSGTGISNGMMIANVKCSSCASWDGGNMDFKSSSTKWIWATKQGSAINNQAYDADIYQHDIHGTFTFDLTKAAGGSEPNPFVTTTSGGSMTAAVAPAATSGSSGGGMGSSSSGTTVTAPRNKLKMVIQAHGAIMGVAFVFLFPLGAFLLHLLPSSVPHKAWIHGGNQLFAFALAIAGMGLGIWFANQTEKLKEAHPIIGLVVVSLLFFQAIGGVLAHAAYKKQGKRVVTGMVHAWQGRALVILGLINGGLGLQLAHSEMKDKIAYGVFAGLVGVSYLAFIVFVEFKKPKSPVRPDGTEKAHA